MAEADVEAGAGSPFAYDHGQDGSLDDYSRCNGRTWMRAARRSRYPELKPTALCQLRMEKATMRTATLLVMGRRGTEKGSECEGANGWDGLS